MMANGSESKALGVLSPGRNLCKVWTRSRSTRSERLGRACRTEGPQTRFSLDIFVRDISADLLVAPLTVGH